MVKKSLWLDVAPKKGQSVASQNATATTGNESGGWNTGTVLEVYPDSQAVRVRIPASAREGEGIEQTGPSDGLVTGVGATVVVLLDGSGRITQVVSPRVIPEGATPVATGVAGTRLLEAMSEAKEAQSRADGVRARAQEAFDKAEEAKASVDGFDARIGAAQLDASAALSKANDVDAKASQAQALASSAQSAASKALSKAASADGRYTSSDHNPLGSEGAGKPVGALWDVVSGGLIVRRFTWTGTAWQQVKIGADTIGKDAVTADAVYASKEMWSKLAVFDEAVIDKLVAQNAVIPGTLVGNELVGKTISGSTLSLLGVKEYRDQEFIPTTTIAGWSPLPDGSTKLRVGESGIVAEGTATEIGLAYKYPVPVDAGARLIVFLNAESNDLAGTECTVKIIGNTATGKSRTYTYTAAFRENLFANQYAVEKDIKVTDVQFLVKKKGKNVSRKIALTVLSARMSWEAATSSGLEIARSKAGEASIVFSGEVSQTILTPDRVSVEIMEGRSAGSQTWRSLVAPPIAICTWPGKAGVDTPAGEGELKLNWCDSKKLLGGFSESGGWLIAPITGWYMVTAITDWSYTSAKDGWAVSTGIRRRGNTGTDWDRDPSDTRAFTANINIRPTAVGMMKLLAGEGIMLTYWQNTGAWKPTGKSRLNVQFITAG